VTVQLGDCWRRRGGAPANADHPDRRKGIGEIGIVGTAAAVANAAHHATGKRFRQLPLRVDRVLDALA
jgi:xanthine dehydrogenase YagR molybdenum-binding subunit